MADLSVESWSWRLLQPTTHMLWNPESRKRFIQKRSEIMKVPGVEIISKWVMLGYDSFRIRMDRYCDYGVQLKSAQFSNTAPGPTLLQRHFAVLSSAAHGDAPGELAERNGRLPL